jgi:protein-S-isoprenylcysteine O-methyltransferase Ste14
MAMILAIYHLWIVGLWTTFLIYWTVAAIFVKRGIDRVALRQRMKVRLALFLVIVGTVILARRSATFQTLQQSELHSPLMALAGAILVTLGAILAFTARAIIGRNWGSPGMRKTDTELVTSGPYSLIRHPIYSGVLMMLVGTAIGLTPTWWLVAIAAGAYFIVSARSEERYMAERFPDAYPAYLARTKLLIPFLL